jgi:hypothetical protein
VVSGCSNTIDPEEGIVLHTILYANDDCLESQKRRRKWVNFIQSTRKKWTESLTSKVCLKHFVPADFENRFVGSVPAEGETLIVAPRLKRDKLSICIFPSVVAQETQQEETRLSERDCRHIVSGILLLFLLFFLPLNLNNLIFLVSINNLVSQYCKLSALSCQYCMA